MRWGARTSRRHALRLSLLGVAAVAVGCRSEFAGLRLTIATGNKGGVYAQFGIGLAGIWAGQLGITQPTLLLTGGSEGNISLLLGGKADVAFSTADAITVADQGSLRLRALARIYDDYIQVVVRADGPIRTLADLAGKRVSIGALNSQAGLVASRILTIAGVNVLNTSNLSVQDAADHMADGKLDAFFWSGGLPTVSITTLANRTRVHLLDLGNDPSGVLHRMIDEFPVYGPALIPADTYRGLATPVTTLTVPNFLLVTDRMTKDVAYALVSGLLSETGELVAVTTAARSIDVHSAIYTEPIPLHPGAEQYYRQTKI
jgi:TRAP transporter TAXI family solute receptor